jgi:hypothetical protein
MAIRSGSADTLGRLVHSPGKITKETPETQRTHRLRNRALAVFCGQRTAGLRAKCGPHRARLTALRAHVVGHGQQRGAAGFSGRQPHVKRERHGHPESIALG